MAVRPQAASCVGHSDDQLATKFGRPVRIRTFALESEQFPSGRRVLAALGCGAFVVTAVLLEMVSGQAANSPSTARYQTVVPLGWPAPVRVLWWLAVAGAAMAHRRLLHPSPRVRARLFAMLLGLPFVVFAAGIAVGADWATWH